VHGISLESSHNVCHGRVLRLDYISQVKKLIKKNKGMKLHLDGARCWNAAIFLGVEPKAYANDFDLISVCLSKGMGCPAGSLIVGSHEDIKTARDLRKMLGGGMR
jgi:threonine aldolase